MNRCTIAAVAAACAGVGPACGGVPGEVDPTAPPGLVSTMSALSSGATLERAYVGVDDDLTLDGAPVLATMDLVGGARMDLEVVTTDSSPVRFEVWSIGVDGTALLVMPVDAPSGFALEAIHAQEDATWAIRFDGGQHADVIVHMDCLGGAHGCAELRQPGQTCPVGWTCDVGLVCERGTCSLASVGAE